MINTRPNIGDSVDQIPTPSLLIDVPAMDHNFSVISQTYAGKVCKMRQHAKNIKSPVVMQRQIDAGGTLNGVCAAKVAEAEVMVEGGIRDILVTSEVTSPDKLRRLASLAKIADVKLCIDNQDNLEQISQIASDAGCEIGVLIEVDTSMGRAGVRSPAEGVALARRATDLNGVKFMGVMSHQTVDGWADRETRFTEGRRYIEICLEVKTAIEGSGIPVEMVSSGETFTFDVAPEIEGVTEVEGGTYALMSVTNGYMEDFQIAAKVITTVLDVRDEYGFIDAGVQCLGGPLGVKPSVDGHPDIEFVRMDASESCLRSKGPFPFDPGDRIFLLSAQQDILVNRWDSFVAINEGEVEAVWDIPARGCHH